MELLINKFEQTEVWYIHKYPKDVPRVAAAAGAYKRY